MDCSAEYCFENSSEINKLTIGFMCNKNKYNKYLSILTPEIYQENQEQQSKIKKYSNEIIELTRELIDNPQSPVSHEITDAFDKYVKICIRSFEWKEMELDRHNNDINDDEVLFGSISKECETFASRKNIPEKSEVYGGVYGGISREDPLVKTHAYKSYWGKSIRKNC